VHALQPIPAAYPEEEASPSNLQVQQLMQLRSHVYRTINALLEGSC
jgi:hypothetical protein